MKITTIAIPTAIIAVFIGGIVLLTRKNNDSVNTTPSTSNVSMIDKKQVITINAKGGYSPRMTAAKADMPTVIKVMTKGTFDCSAALTIPNLKYRTNLSPSGVTEVEVPPQKSGTTLQGLCAMGMYNFSVKFN